MIPGTGVGAFRIQQSHLQIFRRQHPDTVIEGPRERETHETFSQSVATLLSVPTNATGANHSTMSAKLPSHDVT